jgi:DMSO/TMAO reductase YedYZ molybdopterin-dependent catalytic subunit
MREGMDRREFFKKIGIGTIGLGFGISVFDGIYQYAEALTEEQKHDLLMKGTVNFMGFMTNEITPNENFYITSYSSKVPSISTDKFQLRIEGLVERPYALPMRDLEAMQDISSSRWSASATRSGETRFPTPSGRGLH